MALFYRLRLFAAALALVLAASELVGNAAAATYVVGDNMGWVVPAGGAADYATWASRHTLRRGDILVFNFTTGFHDVARVSRAGFDGCNGNGPLALATIGPASLTLNSTGPDYYICTFGQHCSLGQKLAINVTASTPTPTPAPPGRTPAPTPAPTSPPTTRPPALAPTPASPPAPSIPSPTPSPASTSPPAPSVPSPTPSPSPSFTPGATPSGAPSPSSSSSPSPPTGPASPLSPPGSEGPSPPTSPSSAMITTSSAWFIISVLIFYCLVI